jgi:hypothetical protein
VTTGLGAGGRTVTSGLGLGGRTVTSGLGVGGRTVTIGLGADGPGTGAVEGSTVTSGEAMPAAGSSAPGPESVTRPAR